MGIKLRPVFWVKDEDKSGMCPIAISIAGLGRQTYYNTGIKCPEKYWDSENRKIKKGFINYDAKNLKLETMIQDAEREILIRETNGEQITVDIAKKILSGDRQIKGGGFIKFYRDYLDFLTTRHTKGYLKHCEVEFKQFSAFVKGSISFADITPKLLQEYEASLTKIVNKEVVSVSGTTKHTKMKRLREIIKKAVEQGHMEQKQIAGYKWPKYTQPQTEYLTLSEVEKIADEVYKGKFDDDRELKKVACFFLVECLSGIRISDWRKFSVEKLISGDNFKCRATKNGAPVYLPLSQFTRLKRILDYIQTEKLVFDITDQAANRLLKMVAKQAKIKKVLTSHVGRRSCATMLAEMGYSTFAISEVLGVTENTAKIYRHVTRQTLRNEIERLGGL